VVWISAWFGEVLHGVGVGVHFVILSCVVCSFLDYC
jgi:hypothetical protein